MTHALDIRFGGGSRLHEILEVIADHWPGVLVLRSSGSSPAPASSVFWLAIMLARALTDYLTRVWQ